MRVLSELSGSVVGAVIDDAESRPESDPFVDALRRYWEEGAPDPAATWRHTPAIDPTARRAAEVLRQLTRDLLKDLSMPVTDAGPDAPEAALPANVRPIEGALAEAPALELASDGTWKPSGTSLSSDGASDGLRRGATRDRSRYPRADGGHALLPPSPKP